MINYDYEKALLKIANRRSEKQIRAEASQYAFYEETIILAHNFPPPVILNPIL
jgi:hypothetical protein